MDTEALLISNRLAKAASFQRWIGMINQSHSRISVIHQRNPLTSWTTTRTPSLGSDDNANLARDR